MKYPFPKVELHCHLDGSINPELAYEYANKLNLIEPIDYESFKKQLIVDKDVADLHHYLACFALPIRLLQTKEALFDFTYDLVQRLDKEGLAYAEIRFAPAQHLQLGLSLEEVVEAVLSGVNKAKQDGLSIRIGIICCMMIDPTYHNDSLNMQVVELTKQYLGKGVVGLDLAGGEGLVDMNYYAPFFDRARQLNVPFTIHAGEACGADNVCKALKFKPRRIGHGGNSIHDEDVVKQLIENNITLELCPTSNIHCKNQPSYEQHPLKSLYLQGVRTTINCDNRTLSDITLDDEYDHCIHDMGLSQNDVVKMNIYAMQAALLDDESFKTDVINKLETYLK